jgi:hypothetical protein
MLFTWYVSFRTYFEPNHDDYIVIRQNKKYRAEETNLENAKYLFCFIV